MKAAASHASMKNAVRLAAVGRTAKAPRAAPRPTIGNTKRAEPGHLNGETGVNVVVPTLVPAQSTDGMKNKNLPPTARLQIPRAVVVRRPPATKRAGSDHRFCGCVHQ